MVVVVIEQANNKAVFGVGGASVTLHHWCRQTPSRRPNKLKKKSDILGPPRAYRSTGETID